MFTKEVIIVTPWFGEFGGGAESLARSMARELNRRGVRTIVLTTCSRSPYDDWWSDHWTPGVFDMDGVEVRRFSVHRNKSPYKTAIRKIQQGATLTEKDREDFFQFGVNSTALIDAVAPFLNDEYEVLALPYFFGSTHSAINAYRRKISLVPCFHDEPQFYWSPTQRLLANAKRIFYNSPEEKEMTIKQYGNAVGRKVVEGIVAGVGVELAESEAHSTSMPELPPNYFVYAGRKERGKNVPLLCEWFARYARNARDAKLVFIGGGESHLIPATEEFVDLGFVSEAVKQQVIAGAKAVLTLSENESFSIVLMEGWLLGVPAVVSASSAVLMGHIRRSSGGLYAANAEDFAGILNYLGCEPHVARRLGENGKQYATENFSFDAVLGRYFEVFNRRNGVGA